MQIQLLMLGIGLIVIFLSIIITDRHAGNTFEDGKEAVDEQFVRRILRENEDAIKDRMSEILDGQATELVEKADEQLAHISNEKIMAVNDFSEQLIDKIEQNHKEVVFLYDMLNAKEEEMKEFVQEINKSKVVLEELANKELEKQKMIQHKRIQKELEKQLRKEKERERQKIDLAQHGMLVEEDKEEESLSIEENVSVAPKVVTQMTSLEQEVEANKEELASINDEQTEVENNTTSNDDNQNQVILDLYNEGKSIMEIAKVLGRGQGEVKLVIDLYQGAR
ncbi:MAG: hypothetical protein K5895_04395 [Lachnospiraceae bacterium]|nr:hypothetical protein [Lachnospiraceae bacterium]